MAKWKKLAHVVYQCSYHILWTPKYRYRILEGGIAKAIEEKIRAICELKCAEILELNAMKDHVHMVVSIPPRVSISELMGILKGKRAIVRCSKASMSSRRSRIGGTISGAGDIVVRQEGWRKIRYGDM